MILLLPCELHFPFSIILSISEKYLIPNNIISLQIAIFLISFVNNAGYNNSDIFVHSFFYTLNVPFTFEYFVYFSIFQAKNTTLYCVLECMPHAYKYNALAMLLSIFSTNQMPWSELFCKVYTVESTCRHCQACIRGTVDFSLKARKNPRLIRIALLPSLVPNLLGAILCNGCVRIFKPRPLSVS